MYDFITRHFIASLSPDCKYLSQHATLSLAGEKFTVTGQSVLVQGQGSRPSTPPAGVLFYIGRRRRVHSTACFKGASHSPPMSDRTVPHRALVYAEHLYTTVK